jgi:hypothetical protein
MRVFVERRSVGIDLVVRRWIRKVNFVGADPYDWTVLSVQTVDFTVLLAVKDEVVVEAWEIGNGAPERAGYFGEWMEETTVDNYC